MLNDIVVFVCFNIKPLNGLAVVIESVGLEFALDYPGSSHSSALVVYWLVFKMPGAIGSELGLVGLALYECTMAW